jgi:hypothetical protein
MEDHTWPIDDRTRPVIQPGLANIYFAPSIDTDGKRWTEPKRRATDKNGISEDRPVEFPDVDLTVMVGRNAAVATVDVHIAGETIVATASAKRNQGDEFDYEIGEGLAAGRALKALGEELERRMNARVEARSTLDLHENIAQRYYEELEHGYYSPFPHDDDDNRTAEHDAATEGWEPGW